jgi:hypothetical protein
MAPVFELRRADIKRRAANFTETHVIIPDGKLVARITHGRGAVAASARLVKKDLAMRRAQTRNERSSGWRGENARGSHQ